jgi:biopolymer transport protein ExbB
VPESLWQQLNSTALPALHWLTAFLDGGGPVMWLLAAFSVLLWTLISEQLWFQSRSFVLLRRHWQGLNLPADCNRRRLLTRLLLSQARRRLHHHLSLIKTLVAVCPMLGLLGTVLGMTQVFQVMAIQGIADPRALSTGISHATLTTLAGLVIALPGLYFVQLIEHRTDRLTERLAHKLSP